MKQTLKRTLLMTALAGMVACQVTGAANFDYLKSVDEVAENPLTAYNTVYLGMPRADFGGNFAMLPDWKYMGNSTSYEEKAERTTTNDGVTVTEGIAILAASPVANAKVLAFDNYFVTKDKNAAKEMYSRLVSTVYSNMEAFPQSQTDKKVTWVQNDVTVVVSFDGQKDVNGNYTVLLRRFNNHVLSD